MEFKQYRPEGIILKDDNKFIELIDELHELIVNTSNLLIYETLRLNNEKTHKVSHLLIEFFEDIYFEIGIWNAYENFNEITFGTKLPCTLNIGETENTSTKFHLYRIQHFLWNIYGLIEPNLVFSPNHRDLLMLSNEISIFLANSIKRLPKQSSVLLFLKLPNDDGYDVKKKLIWLGTKSYLFRECFNSYLIKKNLKVEIPVIDDFINQISTIWSGLGVIDILADVLKIPQNRKDNIKSWYERHGAFYIIKSVQGKKISAENIINQQTYRIIVGSKINPFKINELVFGSTVKYGNEWYWSGSQQRFGDFKNEQIQEIRKNFITKSAIVAYRYDKQLLEKAKIRNIELYKEFVEHFGSDFVVFSNGLDFAARLQKKERLKYEKLSEEEFQKLKIKHNLVNKSPNYNFPEGLINSVNEIAVFYNIDEGQEILSEYTSVKLALNKSGNDLTSDDLEFIYALIEDVSISPIFVQKILTQNGKKSVLKAYYLQDEKDIDYLIRKHKGIYFKKNRYPNLTLIDK